MSECLSRCRFCGGDAEMVSYRVGYSVAPVYCANVHCRKCLVHICKYSTESESDARYKAANAWNLKGGMKSGD